MNEQIMVSVVCITYNHVDYIEEAIKGFVNQKTDFKYEVIIHDDASTDGTTQIVLDYAQRYPNLIKTIIQKENIYNDLSNDLMYDNLLPASQGKYIALCEGDDYWIDEYKLQKQVDYMESRPECSLCASRYYSFEVSENCFWKPFGKKAEADEIISDMDTLMSEINDFHTSTLVFRKECRLKHENFFRNKKVYD